MIRRTIAAVFLTAVWLPNGLAQTSATGSIVGAVSEASGGMVSGAAIEVVDPASGQTRSARTNESGEYTIPNLPPGVYKVAVSAAGFRQSVVPGLNVEVAKSYTLNFTLQVGDRSDSVEVKDTTAAELQTQDAAVGMVI